MRVIVGLDAPDAGTATIGGRPYHSLKNPQGVAEHRPESPQLHPDHGICRPGVTGVI